MWKITTKHAKSVYWLFSTARLPWEIFPFFNGDIIDAITRMGMRNVSSWFWHQRWRRQDGNTGWGSPDSPASSRKSRLGSPGSHASHGRRVEVVLIVPQVVVRVGSEALVVTEVMVDAVVVVVMVVLVVTVVVVGAVVAIVLVVNSLICTPKNSNHVRSQ